MIYYCEDCANCHNCHQPQENYRALTKAVKALSDATWGSAKSLGSLHCYASLSLKCDYFILSERVIREGDACNA